MNTEETGKRRFGISIRVERERRNYISLRPMCYFVYFFKYLNTSENIIVIFTRVEIFGGGNPDKAFQFIFRKSLILTS